MPTRSSPAPSTRRWLGAALVAAFLLLMPAAAHAEAWLPYYATYRGDPNDLVAYPSSGVDFASSPNGTTTFASTNPASGTLNVTRVLPSGAQSARQSIGSAAAGPPVVAVAASGITAIAWRGPEAAGAYPIYLVNLSAGDEVGSDGHAGPIRTVATVPVADTFDRQLALGVDDAGDATVVWRAHDAGSGSDAVQARRVAADGTLGPIAVLGSAGPDADPQVAVSPAGVSWIAWTDETKAPDGAWAARLDTTGAVDRPRQQLSATGVPVANLGLAAGAAGGVVAWTEPEAVGAARFRGVRLQTSGDLAGDPFEGDAFSSGLTQTAAPAIGPDGTVTLAWVGADAAGSGTATKLSRLEPGASTAPAQTIASSPGSPFDGTGIAHPMLAGGPGGALVVAWVEGGHGPSGWELFSRRVAPDGTVAPVAPGGNADDPGGRMKLTADDVGGGQIGYLSQDGDDVSLRTLYLDSVPPVVQVSAPATLTAGQVGAFVERATDRSYTALDSAWDFGDGTPVRHLAHSHAYAAPGTYTAAFTATDAAGNRTVVTTPPVTVIAPPGEGHPPPPPAPRHAAKLKLAKVSRTGARITLSGRASTRTSGKVTIAYARRIGKKVVTGKTTAKLVKGQWKVTLKLKKRTTSLPRATITVSYAGDADTLRATVRRTLAAPKVRHHHR